MQPFTRKVTRKDQGDLQYMHGINVAASSYHWDNVASYDLTFRQLMAFKPHCSWAKTYNQGWNLAMRDPMAKNNNVAYK